MTEFNTERETENLETEPDTSHLPGEPAKKPKMAIFGGSFDPLHNAHLFIAGEIIRRRLAEEVLFVPARQPPHKTGVQLTPAELRLEMLQKTLQHYGQFGVSDIEIGKEETSYTYHTLEMLSAAYPEHDITFVIGADSLQELHEWYEATELVNRYRFLIYPRPGITMPAYSRLAQHFGYKNARKLQDAIINTHGMAISATEIRQLANQNGNLAGLVPETVQAFISDHNLYTEEQE